jgi:hypothetical protein
VESKCVGVGVHYSVTVAGAARREEVTHADIGRLYTYPRLS